jgi:hypothetical protein
MYHDQAVRQRHTDIMSHVIMIISTASRYLRHTAVAGVTPSPPREFGRDPPKTRKIISAGEKFISGGG